jgi:hypothetical protein
MEIFLMSEPIDIIKIVKELPLRRRGRACIVLTNDYRNQSKWANDLANKTDSKYINLLELFNEDNNLNNNIRHFNVSKLFELLKSHKDFPVIIISNMEFLKATWVGQPNALKQFVSNIETWNNPPGLLFVIQYDKYIATRRFKRYPQYSFVVDQKETLAL